MLFTDFGADGPYLGQVENAILRTAPAARVINLLSDAPAFDARASAYLLAGLVGAFDAGAIFAAIVDPGVGSKRAAIIVEADGRWFVGPDNGVLEIVARRGATSRWWPIEIVPEPLSATFHGRDLFAPAAAKLANGASPETVSGSAARTADDIARPDWPDDLDRIVYIDRYGNAMTGRRASSLDADTGLAVGGRILERYRTFADSAPGAPFWYENSSGLVEIAVNQGRVAELLDLAIDDAIGIVG